MIQLSAESVDLNAFGRKIEYNIFCEALNDSETELKSGNLNFGAESEMLAMLFSCLEMDNLEAKLKSCDLNSAAK